MPVWNWVSLTLIPDETQAYVNDTKVHVLKKKLDGAITRAAQFWPIAAEAISKALSTEAGRQAAQKSLGDVFAVDDAAEMALLLAAGQAMEQLSVLLPAPVVVFHEQLVWEVREIYTQLTQTNPDAAAYVPVVTMNRLSKPWEALRLPLLVTRHTDETLISKTDMGLVGEILFARMEMLKESIQATRHPLFSAETLMEEVKTFADLSSNITKEIELKRQGEWGKRLLSERVEDRQGDGKFHGPRAARSHRCAAHAQRPPARISASPSAQKKAKWRCAMRGWCRAAAISPPPHRSPPSSAPRCDDLGALLKRYNEDLVKALKSDPHNEIATAQFALCTELTAMLFSEEEAELLRRRGRRAAPIALRPERRRQSQAFQILPECRHERRRHLAEITFILALTLNWRRRFLRTSPEGANMETFPMFRTPIIAAMTVALLGGTALAQPASSPPANLSNSARSAPDYDDENGPPPGYQGGPPPGYQNGPPPGYQQGPSSRRRSRRRLTATCSAAAMPRRAPAISPRIRLRSHEQANGTIGGTLGGAALGAVLGAAAGNAGLGAAAGAGAGLIAGTAVGADNARHAAADVKRLMPMPTMPACMKIRPAGRRYGPAAASGLWLSLSAAAAIITATAPIPIIRTIMARA